MLKKFNIKSIYITISVLIFLISVSTICFVAYAFYYDHFAFGLSWFLWISGVVFGLWLKIFQENIQEFFESNIDYDIQ